MPGIRAPRSQATGVTAGSEATPHVFYVATDASVAAPYTQDGSAWATVPLGRLTRVAGSDAAPAASVDTDPESPTFGRIVDPTGRAFIKAIQLSVEVTAPDEADEAQDLLALNLSASLGISARNARRLARKKAREGDVSPRPFLRVEANIGGVVGETVTADYPLGWGTTRVLFDPAAFAGQTAQTNGFWVRCQVRPDPSVAAFPEVTVTLPKTALYDL